MSDHSIDNNPFGTLSARAVAAVDLRVPSSGNPDLDAMIRTAQRRDLAAQVLASMISSEADGTCYSREKISKDAMQVADRLIRALSRPVAEKEG